MARTLVESLAADWDPAKYTDDYRENLMKVIRAKMKGREAKLEAPEEKQSADVVDLMERLRRSLEGGKAKAPVKSASRRAPRATAADRKGKTASRGHKPVRAKKKHAA